MNYFTTDVSCIRSAAIWFSGAFAVCYFIWLVYNRNNQQVRVDAIRVPFGSTNHWSQLCILDDGVRNYRLVEDFQETLEAPLEGRLFKIMKGYDRVLRNIDGDNMQLPPEDQRQPKHGHATLSWK